MLGIIVSVSLLLFWILVVYLSKRRLYIILVGVGIGIAGVFSLAGAVEYNWCQITGISLTEYQSKTVLAPVVEELSKFLFIFSVSWYAYHKRNPFATELFGASVGLGFAFIENFSVAADPLSAFFRGFLSWATHMVTALFLSYGVRRLLGSKSKRNAFCVIILLIAAMGIHSLFNHIVLSLGFH